MKRNTLILIGIALFFCPVFLQAQESPENMSFLGRLGYDSDLNDIWGYTDEEGNEYALVGLRDGISIVDVSDPSNPTEVFSKKGPSTTWRDIKTWDDHAYITNEDTNGLLVVDLGPLPQDTNLPTNRYNGNGAWSSAHNIYIDENGVAYIFGPDRGNGGTIMLDLTQDPKNPVELGFYDQSYVHDGMARGDTLYAGHIQDGYFAIVDVSDKSAPQVLGTRTTPNDFAHNNWLSDDGDHLFTTDEKANAYIGAYDISDPGNITQVDKVRSNPGSEVIPHNTHFINDYLVTSYYRDGVLIHDAKDPSNLVEVGHFDTSPLSGNGFDGCWGVYPWLPSGNIIASDIDSGLFVLSADYKRGAYLEGKVSEAGSGSPLNGVEVNILGVDGEEFTDIAGDYATGTAKSGSFTVVFSKPTHYPDTVKNVKLENDSTTIVDVQLESRPQLSITGKVKNSATGDGVEGAEVRLENAHFTYPAVTDSNGDFSVQGVYTDGYAALAGKWGMVTSCDTVVVDTNSTASITIEVAPGYYDDFAFDFGWSVTDNTNNGAGWEWATPVGTFVQGFEINPGQDFAGDCSDKIYVTGNDIGGAGADGIDSGSSKLVSPSMDLTGLDDPYLSYRPWFASVGRFGAGDDSMFVSADNGNKSVVLDTLTGYKANWDRVSVRLKEMITPTADLRVRFTIADKGDDHVVEGGLDHFQVTEGEPTGISDHRDELTVAAKVYPNPFDKDFFLNYELPGDERRATIDLVDLSGRSVFKARLMQNRGEKRLSPDLSPGVYFLHLKTEGGHRRSLKLIRK